MIDYFCCLRDIGKPDIVFGLLFMSMIIVGICKKCNITLSIFFFRKLLCVTNSSIIVSPGRFLQTDCHNVLLLSVPSQCQPHADTSYPADAPGNHRAHQNLSLRVTDLIIKARTSCMICLADQNRLFNVQTQFIG